MAKASPRLRKTLSQANLSLLGAERLAGLLMDAALSDPALKRSLRLELAAELGASDLAQALDKRMDELAGSRARMSWRKRPELIRELQRLRSMIVDRLGKADPAAAFPRLVAWFDLQGPLASRVKDPREELAGVFHAGAGDVGPLARAAGPGVATDVLVEALRTRSATWGTVMAHGVNGLDAELAQDLLAGLTDRQVAQEGRVALIVRRLAERVGNTEIWAASFDARALSQPEVQVELADRLARDGRPVEARSALEAALARPAQRRLGWQAPQPAPQRTEAWFDAEIAVLEAEGRAGDAMTAMWLRFERRLSVESLNAILGRLDDFEDVVARDRALAFAADAFDLNRSLALMLDIGALREASDMVLCRQAELTGRADQSGLWASKLSARFPAAALLIVRARALALAGMADAGDEAVASLVDEAQALANLVEGDLAIATHTDFLAQLAKAGEKRPRQSRL